MRFRFTVTITLIHIKKAAEALEWIQNFFNFYHPSMAAVVTLDKVEETPESLLD